MKVINAALAAGRFFSLPLPSLPTDELQKHLPKSNFASCSGVVDYGNEIASRTLEGMMRALAEFGVDEALDRGMELTQDGLDMSLENVDLKKRGILDASREAYNSIEAFLTSGENAGLGPLRGQLEGKMERIVGDDGAVEW